MQKLSVKEDWLTPLVRIADFDTVDEAPELNSFSLFRDIRSCQEYCNRITAFHSKSFYMASGLLPKEKRQAIRNLYAFCRTTDDIVDEANDVENSHLERWRNDTTRDNIRFNDPVVIAWAQTRRQFKIPNLYARQLIDGVEMDLYKKRYQNFEELTEYCYRVASTVGLMSMHITGFESARAIPYAIKLGVALQLTNILRDINEDWTNGRLYLPQDELDFFGITADHFNHKINDGAWKQFMRFQITRTQKLYKEAWPGIQLLHPDGRLAIAAAATFYRGILNKIISLDYDVFSHRASISKWGKVKRIPDLLMKYKFSNSLNSILT